MRIDLGPYDVAGIAGDADETALVFEHAEAAEAENLGAVWLDAGAGATPAALHTLVAGLVERTERVGIVVRPAAEDSVDASARETLVRLAGGRLRLVATTAVVAEPWETRVQAAERFRAATSAQPDGFTILRDVHVAAQTDDAWERAAAALGRIYDDYEAAGHLGGNGGALARGRTLWAGRAQRRGAGRAVVGDPATVLAQLEAYRADTASEWFVCRIGLPAMDRYVIDDSLALFLAEVVPALRSAPLASAG